MSESTQPTDADADDFDTSLEEWRFGAVHQMRARADGGSDGLYANLDSAEELLEPFDPDETVRACAWSEDGTDGNMTSWTATVYGDGDRISIPEHARRDLGLRPDDRILWGVAPIGAPDPDVDVDGEWSVDEIPPLVDVADSNKQNGSAEDVQARLPSTTLDGDQRALKGALKEEIAEARFADDLAWDAIAEVLEDVHGDVAEQAQFTDH